MFQKIILFLVVIILVLFQGSFLVNFFPEGLVPNLVLSLVVFWIVRAGFNESWPGIVLAGFFLDLAHNWTIGISILSLAIVAFLISSLVRRLSVAQGGLGFVMILGFVFFGSLVNDLIINYTVQSIFWLRGFESGSALVYPFGVIIFWNALLTSAGFVVLYWPLKKIEERVIFYNKGQFTKTRFLK